jgi:hypothetical protein
MLNFINLSSRVINKLHIVEIIKTPSKYYIRMSDLKINGCLMFGSGGVGGESHTIEICEKEYKQDYDIITNCIKNINN